jgi:peptidylprolyl isomerase
MKLRLLAAALAAITLTAGAVHAQDTTSEKGKLSYYFGYRAGAEMAELAARGEQIDTASVTKGLQDALAKKDPAISEEQMRPAFEAFQKRQQARMQEAKAKFDKAAADNKTKSDGFLAQNKAKPGVKTLPSGVQYRVIENGTGAKPTQASTVELEVLGPLPWGQRPAQATAQKMPALQVSKIEMPAMREALLQMPAGSKWEIVLPPDKAFGADPRAMFPPNAAAVFEVKLLSVK